MSLAKPLFFVSEQLPGHLLLKAFIKRRSHLFGVMDEYGDLTGVVSLEDVLESVIGEEIVDEVDIVADMQEVARRRKREQYGSQKHQLQQDESGENSESIELFRKLEYDQCAHFKKIGEKWGRAIDVIFFQKSLENIIAKS